MDPQSKSDDLLREALVGGLLGAYAQGLFPMAHPGPDGQRGPICWYNPDPRGVFGLGDGGLTVSRSLRQRVRSGRFEVTCDAAFEGVMRACAQPRDDDGTWIDDRIVAAYTALHEAGYAHSFEAWLEGELVGGLYGVHLRGLFAGESMFSRPEQGGTDASKVCLVHLWHHLRSIGAVVLDTQFWTPHLASLGCCEIGVAEYHRVLGRALASDVVWGNFDPSFAVGRPEA